MFIYWMVIYEVDWFVIGRYFYENGLKWGWVCLSCYIMC